MAATGSVATAAALVMVCVFSLFGTLSSLELKQAGVGMAAGHPLDATLIRGVLLPASLKLLGELELVPPAPTAVVARGSPASRSTAMGPVQPSLDPIT